MDMSIEKIPSPRRLLRCPTSPGRTCLKEARAASGSLKTLGPDPPPINLAFLALVCAGAGPSVSAKCW